jgi:hypothetical protein
MPLLCIACLHCGHHGAVRGEALPRCVRCSQFGQVEYVRAGRLIRAPVTEVVPAPPIPAAKSITSRNPRHRYRRGKRVLRPRMADAALGIKQQEVSQ